MSVRKLRSAFPNLFHPNQDWFEHEPFMDVPGHAALPHFSDASHLKFWETDRIDHGMSPPHAVTLAALYVAERLGIEEGRAPAGKRPSEVWSKYLWTGDTDRAGQRVYLGDNGKGLEIHRHIHTTPRFGIVTWA